MNKKTIFNFISSLFCQLMILAFGLIVPKVLISNLGSEANGFLSTTNQIFAYISLVEAGLGTTLLNALYFPIHSKDFATVSALLTSADKRFKKTAFLYLIISILFGFLYPLLLKVDNLSYLDMCLSIIVYGIGGAANLFFSSAIIQYLVASGRGYVQQWVHLGVYVAASLLKIVAIVLTRNVIIVCLSYSSICLIGGLIYSLYFKTRCKPLVLNSKQHLDKPLKEQKYFLIHQISGAIFGSTDLLIISIFCSLNESSIYSVYALIFSSIQTITTAIFNSLQYILGDAYSQNIERYKKVHDMFDSIYLAVMFALLFVAYNLANGFVGVYMNGSDINYVDKWFPLLFVSAKLLSSCRAVCNNTHNVAHHARQNLPYTILESIINLVASLVLTCFIGVYGVLLGTIIALLFRTNQTIIYTNKNLLNRSPFATYKYIIIYTIVFIFSSILFQCVLAPSITSYLSFVIWGICLTLIILVIYITICLLVNKDVRNALVSKVFRFL